MHIIVQNIPHFADSYRQEGHTDIILSSQDRSHYRFCCCFGDWWLRLFYTLLSFWTLLPCRRMGVVWCPCCCSSTVGRGRHTSEQTPPHRCTHCCDASLAALYPPLFWHCCVSLSRLVSLCYGDLPLNLPCNSWRKISHFWILFFFYP